MSRGKKIVLAGVAVLVLALAGAGWALGEAYQNSPLKKGPAYFLEKMESGAQALNLTPAQREEFEALKAEVRESMDQGHKEGRDFFESLKSEVNKPEPDLEAVTALIKVQMVRLQERVGQGMDRFTRFYQTLDARQKEQVLAKVRTRMDQPHPHGPGSRWCDQNKD